MARTFQLRNQVVGQTAREIPLQHGQVLPANSPVVLVCADVEYKVQVKGDTQFRPMTDFRFSARQNALLRTQIAQA